MKIWLIVIIGVLVAGAIIFLVGYRFLRSNSESQFEQYLQTGDYQKAYELYEEASAKEHLKDELDAFLTQLDVSMGRGVYDSETLQQKFSGLSVFGKDVAGFFSSLRDKTVYRYENYSLTYEQAKDILEKIDMLSPNSEKSLETDAKVEEFRNLELRYNQAKEMIAQEKYIEVLPVLTEIKGQRSEKDYIVYLANAEIEICAEQIKSNANNLAVDGEFKQAITMLQELLRHTEDDEARVMVSRIYNASLIE